MTARTLSDLVGETGARPNLYFNIGAINRNPHLAARIAEVITAYSYIDAELLRVVVEFCDGTPDVVAAVWAKLRNSTLQDGMLKAVMGVSVDTENQDLFRRVLEKIVQPARDTRNDFAHHLWGFAAEFKDYALLIDPKVALRLEASNIGGVRALWAEENRHLLIHGILPPRPNFDADAAWDRWNPDFIRAYDIQDLTNELLRATEIMNAIYYLRFALRDQGDEGAQARKVLMTRLEPQYRRSRAVGFESPLSPPAEDQPL